MEKKFRLVSPISGFIGRNRYRGLHLLCGLTFLAQGIHDSNWIMVGGWTVSTICTLIPFANEDQDKNQNVSKKSRAASRGSLTITVNRK